MEHIRRTNTALVKTEARIIQLLTDNDKHYTHQEIADIMAQEGDKVSRQTVTNISSKHKNLWRGQMKKNISEHLQIQLERLEHQYEELEQLYLESSREKVTITTQVSDDGAGVGKESNKNNTSKKAIKRVESSIGDVQILNSMRAVLVEQNKLLGLYTEKVEHSGKVELEIETRFKNMTAEELSNFIKEQELEIAKLSTT